MCKAKQLTQLWYVSVAILQDSWLIEFIEKKQA